MDFSRRNLILGALGSAAWPQIAAAQEHARHALQNTSAVPRFEFFDVSTAADIAALASQILPSDGEPGATEAGVIFFVDRALLTFASDKQALYRSGLDELRTRRRQKFPASNSLASLSNEQQAELVRAIETSEFFEVLRIHTLLGFLGNPSYAGNRDKVGWKYIGFEDRMSWKPPFGYYDRETQ
jgi:gluconate 2-dehydrogenase gamma chain